MTSPQEDANDPSDVVTPAPEAEEDAVEASGASEASQASQEVPDRLPPSYRPARRPTPLAAPDRADAAPSRRRGSTLLIVLVVLLAVALLKTYVLQTFGIPSGSMEDTLLEGDRVAVTMYDADEVERGDIIVFTDPDNWLVVTEPTGVKGAVQDVLIFLHLLPEDSGHHLIKRVIGVGGDHIVADGNGSLTINGVEVDEPYLKAGRSASDVAFDVTVPDGYVWVMGDNRANSADSRFHQNDANGGVVPLDNVVGVAKAVLWPASRWSTLSDGGAFDAVPDASATATAGTNP
ncbi:signal peptidase I [Actinomyces sp. MRS3W]|uniref:signal peptidase I n=1 Tax=Actinomyces sp. MRS3W TaxID=2800796 RepID=UPI0028FD1715|nr:signal peptidase I [Actinomyces sp. MRS3W]MDU0349461.1 signal peptidase I [Actinomyces sp. MRS3W]